MRGEEGFSLASSTGRSGASDARLKQLARGIGWASFAGVLAGWITIALLGDRIWWALPVLFGPRWIWAVLALGMIPWLVTAPRRAALPAAIAVVVVLFGIMDFRLGLGRLFAGHGAAVRVFELNAGAGSGGIPDPERILAEIDAEDPDVAVIAECSGGLPDLLSRTMTAYHVHINTADLCLLSKGTIEQVHSRDQMEFWKLSGSGAIVWAVVDTPAGPVRLGMVHLSTPRNALDNYPDLSSIPHLGPVTQANTVERAAESRAARQWILSGPDLPTIVAGDFNLPVESAIYRRYWGAFGNALSEAGIGTVYTKHTRWWGVRIDHVLFSHGIHARRAYVGPDVGSDHEPVIADLVVPTAQ